MPGRERVGIAKDADEGHREARTVWGHRAGPPGIVDLRVALRSHGVAVATSGTHGVMRSGR